MSKFTPTKSRQELTFYVDGLLVAVRYLCVRYKIDYESTTNEEPCNEYILLEKVRNRTVIGKAYTDEKGIVINFSINARDLLIKKGCPVLHPEEIEEHGQTDLVDLALEVSFVVGNHECEVDDESQTIIIYREVQDV